MKIADVLSTKIILYTKLCLFKAMELAVCNEFYEKLSEILSIYATKDVFNVDETGLYHKLLPNKTLAFKSKTCISDKFRKNRIIVIVAANMDRNEN